MASWLTSRLKAAEQLLQQIDQQAAITKENLHKPDADLTSFLSPEVLRVGRRAKEEQPSSTSTRPDTLNLPSQSGHGKSRQPKRSNPPLGTRNSEAVPGPSKEDKRDWAELLGSNDLNSPMSASRSSSSVGSTDFGGNQNVSRGGSQRAFHTAGKIFGSSLESNEPTPSSKMSLAGAPTPSVQASRTKGPSKYITEVRASEAQHKADNSYEEENMPRKLEYGAQGLEGTGEHDPTEQPTDIIAQTIDSDKAADPITQPENQDGEFTELELSVPDDIKNLEDANLEASVQDNIVEEATQMLPGQSSVLVDETGSTDTPTSVGGDPIFLAQDGELTHKIRVQAGDSTPQDGGDQQSALDERSNAEETEDSRSPVQTAQGTDRGNDDDASAEGSSLSESDDESRSGSGSGSGSGSESDSEYEERVRRRRERRKELAERRAAKAAAVEAARAAVRDREELVAKLEQEKEDLEKLIAEMEDRQVKEAEELNLTMKEVAEAVEVEKQRHAMTRREGLAQEAQLEAQNQELAKALAAAERNLEDESARVALARSKVEAKEIIQSDLQRKILLLEYRLRPPSQPQLSQDLQDSKTDRESAEEHYAELTARLEQYQNKAKQLEENIFIARDAHYTPSVMELELETQLNQLTDHLIQKQSQVEALSTEKATLHFRLEAIANTLRMEKSAAQSRATKRTKGVNATTDWSAYDDDLEFGLSKPYSSKDKSAFIPTDPDVILNQTAGPQPMVRLARQVDSVFLVGARILRTSGSARALAALYIFLLHSWVLFILFMHARSGSSGSASDASLQADVINLSSLSQTLNSTAFNQ